MQAQVEVRNVFLVKGRGAVAIGYLRQGTVRVGQQTRPMALGTGPPRVLTLAAVESVRAPDGGESALGLVFRERPSLEDLLAVLTPGTVLTFSDVTGPGTDTD
jgi:translation elongation factor EF-Tu-like GTPase